MAPTKVYVDKEEKKGGVVGKIGVGVLLVAAAGALWAIFGNKDEKEKARQKLEEAKKKTDKAVDEIKRKADNAVRETEAGYQKVQQKVEKDLNNLSK